MEDIFLSVISARLGELILESSLGKKADLVPRCCQISYTFVQRNANYGDLCSALAAAACACAHCGQLESCNFSPCKGQVSPASSLIRQLQRYQMSSLRWHFFSSVLSLVSGGNITSIVNIQGFCQW